jgi:excisionase family DNA binding protein
MQSVQTPPTDASAYPDQMDAEQVAQYIHRNKDTVYRYAREGKLPAQWIDTHPLFAKKDIDEWLAAHPTPAKSKRARKQTL